jgi:hypothetical protein
MAKLNTLGYIYNTSSATGNPTRYGQLVTLDLPHKGRVLDSALGRQGLYILTEEAVDGVYQNETYVLPMPGSNSDVAYEYAPKMEYQWRSKKFVMPGRTTLGAAKVVHKGCVRLRIFADGCCRVEEQVRHCQAFRLPSQIVGTEFEIELVGTGQVYEAHVASTMQELLRES